MKVIAITFILLIPSIVGAQSLKDKCTVRAANWDDKLGSGSGNLILGQFEAEVAEKPTIKSFKFYDTNLIVTAGIEYGLSYSKSKPTPVEVRLAIIVSNKAEQSVFNSVKNSEAETDYTAGWNVAVSKTLFRKNIRYAFTLSCWDNSKSGKQ